MEQYLTYAVIILAGAWMTLKVTLVSSVLAIVVALVTGLLRMSERFYVRALPTLFVELFRGTSCYVQLFWVFFALPVVGISLTPFVASVLVLGALIGSYGSEVVRGAIVAVSRGQTEACIALNYTPFQRFRLVIFPQALVTMLPPAANLLIDLLKLTPLTSLVTVSELTYNAMSIRHQTGSTAVTLGVILVGYFAMSSLIVYAVQRLQSVAGGSRRALEPARAP